MLNGVLNKKITAQFAKLEPDVLAELRNQIPTGAKKAKISVHFFQLVVASLIETYRQDGAPNEIAAALVRMAIEDIEALQIAIMHRMK